MCGCYGTLELQGDTVKLNNDFIRGLIPLFFFGDTRGQAMLPLLGCSIYDFKEIADNQLSRFLKDQAQFIRDAVKGCPEFAKAVHPLDEKLMAAREVASVVHGFTGKTPVEKLAFANHGVSRLEKLIVVSSQFSTKEKREQLRREVLELGVGVDAIN